MFKIVHMTFASLAIIVFVIRTILLFWQPAISAEMGSAAIGSATTASPAPKSAGRIVLVAMQHLSFTLLVITGLVLLYQNNFVVQPWFYGKIILFLVVLSAVTKTFGKRDIGSGQRQAGAMVAGIAFIGLMTLVCWKPNFSDQASKPAGQSGSQVQIAPTTQAAQQQAQQEAQH